MKGWGTARRMRWLRWGNITMTKEAETAPKLIQNLTWKYFKSTYTYTYAFQTPHKGGFGPTWSNLQELSWSYEKVLVFRPNISACDKQLATVFAAASQPGALTSNMQTVSILGLEPGAEVKSRGWRWVAIFEKKPEGEIPWTQLEYAAFYSWVIFLPRLVFFFTRTLYKPPGFKKCYVFPFTHIYATARKTEIRFAKHFN